MLPGLYRSWIGKRGWTQNCLKLMPLVENGIKRAFVHSLEEDIREIYVGYNVEIAGNEYNNNQWQWMMPPSRKGTKRIAVLSLQQTQTHRRHIARLFSTDGEFQYFRNLLSSHYKWALFHLRLFREPDWSPGSLRSQKRNDNFSKKNQHSSFISFLSSHSFNECSCSSLTTQQQ